MHKEVEIKIQITEEQMELLSSWLSTNAQDKGETRQVEYYINNPDNSFCFDNDGMKDANAYLRIRTTDKGDSICLKKFHPDPEKPGRHTHCDEYESDVKDG
jgi:uncharacterized protein YjbK